MLSPVVLSVTSLGVVFLLLSEFLESFGVALPLVATAGWSAAGGPLVGVLRRRAGRPRKFEGPSRAVTLTLPESVIDTLASLNPDLSHAVVALAKRRAPREARRPAEVTVFGKRAVISVSPTPSFEQRTGLELVPLPNGRALITLDSTKTIAEVELLLNDALADSTLSQQDRSVFEAVAGILQDARRSSDVSLLRRTLIVLESAGRNRRRRSASSDVKRSSDR